MGQHATVFMLSIQVRAERHHHPGPCFAKIDTTQAARQTHPRTNQRTIMIVAAMMIIEYLGLAVLTTTQIFIVIFIIVPLAFFLILIIGGRDIISCLLSRRYLINEFKRGDTVTFDSISGEIEKIDFITTKLKKANEEIIIPNSELVKKVIRKKITG